VARRQLLDPEDSNNLRDHSPDETSGPAMSAKTDATTESVRQFYDEYGWVVDGEGSGEDRSFRGYSKAFADYSRVSTRRVLDALGEARGSVLFVGGGDMPESHMAVARTFESIVCLDLSSVGLEAARRKLGDAADYVVGSILDADLGTGVFDVVYCAHVLYHINRNNQEAAVRQMLKACKPGGRVVLVYANPWSPVRVAGRAAGAVLGSLRKTPPAGAPAKLYYYDHPLSWWRRFADQARVRIAPWEAVAGRIATPVMRPQILAKGFVGGAVALEKVAPGLAVALWQYPLIVLEKPSA
jgi:SAM-dependent methyltransferase